MLKITIACQSFREILSPHDHEGNAIGQRPLLVFTVAVHLRDHLERDLREKCTEELRAIGFDGYALGGLAVGETESEMLSVIEAVTPLLPEDQPRYLMGVGKVEQLKSAVKLGIDMFDCVLPMREARHGSLFLSDGSKVRIVSSESLPWRIPAWFPVNVQLSTIRLATVPSGT